MEVPDDSLFVLPLFVKRFSLVGRKSIARRFGNIYFVTWSWSTRHRLIPKLMPSDIEKIHKVTFYRRPGIFLWVVFNSVDSFQQLHILYRLRFKTSLFLGIFLVLSGICMICIFFLFLPTLIPLRYQ